MIEKRKLGLELEALTASSKIILYVLIVVPILFIGFISMIDPTYFSPFFESSFGLAIFAIVVILYMIYIYIVNKLMKVRM
jgi:Flp pilus assembly protein TadB